VTYAKHIRCGWLSIHALIKLGSSLEESMGERVIKEMLHESDGSVSTTTTTTCAFDVFATFIELNAINWLVVKR